MDTIPILFMGVKNNNMITCVRNRFNFDGVQNNLKTAEIVRRIKGTEMIYDTSPVFRIVFYMKNMVNAKSF